MCNALRFTCKLFSTTVSFTANLSIASWILADFEGDYRAISVLFLLPALAAWPLLCASKGSRVARFGGSLMLLTAAIKLGTGGFAFVAASAQSDDDGWYQQLGALVLWALGAVLIVSGAGDLFVGWGSACTRGEAGGYGSGRWTEMDAV